MKISKNWLLVAVVISALAVVGTRVLADTANDIWTYGNYSALTINNAVVDSIQSAPGTWGPAGKSQTYWIVSLADSTGSLVTDFSSASLASLGWTPTVGQNVSVSATWNPYHSIPEIVSATAVTVNSSGNATWSAPGVHGGSQLTTIPAINANPANAGSPWLPLNSSLLGYLVEIANVSITGAGALTTFPTTNETMYLNDSAGNQTTMYYWYSSYGDADQLQGAPIPTASTQAPEYVNVWGYLTSYPSVSGGITTWQDEIIPEAFTAAGIPEPSSFMLAGIGLLSLLAVIRRRHS